MSPSVQFIDQLLKQQEQEERDQLSHHLQQQQNAAGASSSVARMPPAAAAAAADEDEDVKKTPSSSSSSKDAAGAGAASKKCFASLEQKEGKKSFVGCADEKESMMTFAVGVGVKESKKTTEEKEYKEAAEEQGPLPSTCKSSLVAEGRNASFLEQSSFTTADSSGNFSADAATAAANSREAPSHGAFHVVPGQPAERLATGSIRCFTRGSFSTIPGPHRCPVAAAAAAGAGAARRTDDDAEQLVNARLVSDQSEHPPGDLEQARPVYLPSEEQPKNEQRCQRWLRRSNNKGLWCCVLGLFCMLLVVFSLGASLGTVFGSSLDDEKALGGTVGPPAAKTPQDYLVEMLPPESAEKALDDFGSPQFMALSWLEQDPSLYNYSSERLVQRFALATFYYATEGGHWNISKDWLSYDIHECEWYAGEEDGTLNGEIERFDTPCNDEFKYERLWLSKNNLKGIVPDELYLLTSLHGIYLSMNYELSGSISPKIQQLSNLEKLLFARVDLTGTMPTEIGVLSSLRLLYVTIMSKVNGSLDVKEK